MQRAGHFPELAQKISHLFIFKLEGNLSRPFIGFFDVFMPLLFFFFNVGSIPSVELNAGLELTTMRLRPELRSSWTLT